MSEQRQGPTPVEPISPNPPAINAIHDRLIRIIEIRDRPGMMTTKSPDERINTDRAFSQAIRDESLVLDPTDPDQGFIIDSTIINSHQLGAWLKTRGTSFFTDEKFQLESDPPAHPLSNDRDPSVLRFADLRANTKDFSLRYRLYRNDDFELEISYNDEYQGIRPAYKRGRRNIKTDLTIEEAEIIGTFALEFLDNATELKKAA